MQPQIFTTGILRITWCSIVVNSTPAAAHKQYPSKRIALQLHPEGLRESSSFQELPMLKVCLVFLNQ
jgi:hypothetical protein